MNLVIVGAGYVGLVSGACLASAGHHVTCVDKDERKIAALSDGRCPFHEPGIDELVQAQAKAGRLRFESSISQAAQAADIIILAVGTPSRADGAADVSVLFQCAHEIAAAIHGETLVVVKSTAPVGTCEQIRCILAESNTFFPDDAWPHVASNPEFLAEGSAINDFMHPERIVIGVQDKHSEALLREMYRPFDPAGDRLLCMDVRSAEFAKYACNAMLAARISTINELADIAGSVDADILAACRVMGLDPRIGKRYMRPGAGYGGSCLPKDLRALIQLAKDHGESAPLLRSVEAVNKHQVELMAEAISGYFKEGISNSCLAMWGLSFKPGTDDVRAAPSLNLIERLISRGARIQAYDPVASHHVRSLITSPRLTLSPTAQAACSGADALIVMTEWSEFERPDFSVLSRTLKKRIVFDGRHLYDTAELFSHGLQHHRPGQRHPTFPLPSAQGASGGTPLAQATLRQDAGLSPCNLNLSPIPQRSRP